MRLSAFCFRFFLFRSFRSSLSSLPDLIRQSMRKRNLHSAFHRALAPRERESISYSPRARGEVRLPTGPARSGRPDDKLRNPGEGACPRVCVPRKRGEGALHVAPLLSRAESQPRICKFTLARSARSNSSSSS